MATTFCLVLFTIGLINPLVSNAQPPAGVVVEQVVEQAVAPMREFLGTVKPSRRSVIGSAVDGRVVTYLVDAGQAVTDGQVLSELLTGTISIEILGAKAEQKLREAELDELIRGARPEEIAQAEAQLAAAAALESYAASRLERTRQLAKAGGAISTEELELTISQYRSAEQKKIEFRESLNLLKAGTRAEQIAQSRARLDVQVETVNLLEDRRRKYSLKSPFDGFVVKEYTEEGAWVKQGDPIAEVIDIDPVEIEVGVPEGSIRFLKPEMVVKVRIDAIGAQTITGTLSQIVPEADMRARTFPVKIRVPNPTDDAAAMIRPGMLARVILPTGDSVRGLTVAKDAVVFGGGGPVVMKIVDSKAQPVPVEIVVESDGRLLVNGTLAAGDQIVTRGNERLRPGQAVVIQNP